MVRSNGVKTETSVVSDIEDMVTIEEELESVGDVLEDPLTIEQEPESVQDVQDIDDILNSLKSLLSTVDKLQKIRQEVGDIKPLIGRMLDGELLAGDELEQLKIGVSGMNRLVRAYSDHQAALAKAQPARKLLDQVLK